MIKVGVVGGTGYTGVELLRLLATHPEVELHAVTSRAEAGRPISDLFPNLRGYVDLPFSAPDEASLTDCDVVFFATPNLIAMHGAEELVNAGVRVIDLAADFRFKDLELWGHWYGETHACPELAAEAIYGLPEVNREQIKTAKVVGNPGCYPTSVQLGLLPLINSGAIDVSDIIADCKSGVSGAGRGASVGALFSETSDSFQAYKADGHRHMPEIEQNLIAATGNDKINVTFVPHLVPMVRGIQATLYANLTQDVDLQALFEQAYANEPFVDVLPAGSHPQTRSVKSSNMCRIAIHRAPGTDKVIVLSVIDNLVKGAAGQAVQNMNIMFNFGETTGLAAPALLP